MEHNGDEAPFEVICHAPGKFTVFDFDDHDGEHPVASLEDAETSERLALAHFDARYHPKDGPNWGADPNPKDWEYG